jgi:hypothetical protein
MMVKKRLTALASVLSSAVQHPNTHRNREAPTMQATDWIFLLALLCGNVAALSLISLAGSIRRHRERARIEKARRNLSN